MTFSEQEMADIELLRSLLRREPTLNSAEALRQLRGHNGRYPTTRVQNWLHASMGDQQRSRDNVLWWRGWHPDRQSPQAGDGAVGNSPGDLESSPRSQNSETANGDGKKEQQKKLQSQLRNTPRH